MKTCLRSFFSDFFMNPFHRHITCYSWIYLLIFILSPKLQSKLIALVDFRYEVNYKNWTNAQYENDTNQHFFLINTKLHFPLHTPSNFLSSSFVLLSTTYIDFSSPARIIRSAKCSFTLESQQLWSNHCLSKNCNAKVSVYFITPNKLNSYSTSYYTYFLSSDIQLRVRCKDKEKFGNEGIFRTRFKHDMWNLWKSILPFALIYSSQHKLLFWSWKNKSEN